MQKFKVGDQYLTKGGWRADVVVSNADLMLVWHEKDNVTRIHNKDGLYEALMEYDLITPYTEPRKGTVWVNVWIDKDDGIFTLAYTDEMQAKRDLSNCTLLASFKHDWTENEKL